MADDAAERLQRKLDTLPDAAGVYLWKDAAGEVLYVGKAKRLRTRVRSYLQPDRALAPKDELLRRLLADVETIVVDSEAQSLLLENNLIKEYQPRFNVRLKDDKSYPSIAVTVREPFPRVLVTRRRDLDARYFGPYTDVAQMRRTLALIRRLFTVRSCSLDLPRERRDRPCLDYHIGRCLAPCVGWQGEADYRRMIDDVLDFLEGRTGDVRTAVRRMMAEAAGREDFERAAALRDTLKWLEQLEAPPAAVETVGTGDADVVGFARDGDEAVGVLLRVRDGRVIGREHRFLENAEGEPEDAVLGAFLVRYYLPLTDRVRRLLLPFPPADLAGLQALLGTARVHVPQRGTAGRWVALADQNARHLLESLRLETFETEERAEDPVYALGRDLSLSAVPRGIACVDISHNQGRDMVGSLVWFEAGRPRKAEYRRFRIKGLAGQDDYAAIHEVVTRYLTRRRDEGKPVPDLLVIDGGKGQLASAADAAQKAGFPDLPLASLAKRDEEVFLPGRGDPIRLSRRSPSLRLLQRLRDEAHRFGLAYSRHRRTERVVTSELLEIPGVGPSRRSRLLERFGSLAGVRSASLEELMAVEGVSRTLAERIRAHLAS